MSRRSVARQAARAKQLEADYFMHTIPEGIEQQGIALSKDGWLIVRNPNTSGARKLTDDEARLLRDALDKFLTR